MANDPLSLKLSALADPTRRAMLQRLASGEASVTELAAPFAMGMPAVTKHLKVLERAGLISRTKQAQWRPCRLEPQALVEVEDWLGFYRQVVHGGFDRLADHLRDWQTAPQAAPPPAGDAP